MSACPGRAGRCGRRRSRREVVHVVVEEPLAKRCERLGGRCPAQDLVRRQPSVDFEKTHPRETRAVTQDVAKSGTVVRILALHRELELRQVLLDRIVPLHAPVVHQHSDERRGERLGCRPDEKRRVRCDGRLLLHVCHAESSGEDHVIAAHYRQRGTGNMQVDPVAIDLRRQAVEPLRERGSRLLWRDGLRRRRRRRSQKDCSEQQQARDEARAHV